METAKSKRKREAEDTSEIPTATEKLSLKLLIDKKGNRVLWGEAGKDFVDFLFHLLSLPLGSVIKLLSKENIFESLEKIYQSVENLDETYMLPAQKEGLLNPKIPKYANNVPLLLCNNYDVPVPSASRIMYRCLSLPNSYDYTTMLLRATSMRHTSTLDTIICGKFVADNPKAICPGCKKCMNKPLKYVAAQNQNQNGVENLEEGGYVKGVVRYMVMDDLVVKPMSTLSSIALLNTFKVKDLAALEEKVVYLGKEEAVKLLKASLLSDKVLTTVFIGNVKAEGASGVKTERS